MTRYLTNYGRRITVRSPAELVSALRRESFTRSRSGADFMREIAKRVKVQNRNARISTRSKRAFVASLVKAGLLKEEE